MIFKKILSQTISYGTFSPLRNNMRNREARFLKKIIQKSQKNSSQRNHIPKSTSLNDYARKLLFCERSRRISVLDQVFMDHISDLTSAGQYGETLSKMGIHIVKVRVSSNYHIVFVYWIHTREIDEDEVNELLPRVARNLRVELSGLRVIGQIPEIRFVKHEKMMEQEVIDDIINDLSYQRNIKKSDEEGENVNNNEYELVKMDDYDEVKLILSIMKENVFGLDRIKIIENLIGRMKKENLIWGENELITHSMRDENENIKFDKKKLSDTLFQKIFDEKKQAKLRKSLLTQMEDEDEKEDEEEEEEEEEDCFYDDNEDFYQNFENDELEDNEFCENDIFETEKK